MEKVVSLADPRKWRPITIGGRKTGSRYLQTLTDAHFRVSDSAANFLNKSEFVCSTGIIVLDLVVCRSTEISGVGKLYDTVLQYTKIKQLEFCPEEVAPALRLDYVDQPREEHLILPISRGNEGSGELTAFILTRDYYLANLHLHLRELDSEDLRCYENRYETRLVFIKPRR